jgi:hypothetical protein
VIDLAVKPERTDIGMKDVASVLYVGNSFLSFNNEIGWHVSRLHASTNPARRLRSTSVAITGGGLDWHDVDSYFRPNAIGTYSFDEVNNVVFDRHERLFDVVLMMDCSQCPIHSRLKAAFHASVGKSSETVRRNGAKPALLMTWAYANRPEMTAQLAGAYTIAGNENDALVVPVGLAFAQSLSERRDIRLHMDDKSHPTLAGTYLAACTVYAGLFGRSPVGLGHDAGLGTAMAVHLQNAAFAAVRRYYGH